MHILGSRAHLPEIVGLLADAVVHKVDKVVSDVAARCRVLRQGYYGGNIDGGRTIVSGF